ncbi:MAG: Tol-Pal system protein TolB [Alphaproteobacteria bacterium]|nr:Tol-Pal system protein TolB [Alphaproteobacteria bacterium]
MRNLILVIFTISMCLFCFTSIANAQTRIDITTATVEPISVAIPEFATTSPSQRQMAHDIPMIISNDLMSSGLFRKIDKNSYIQDPASTAEAPRFGEWRSINAKALVSAKLIDEGKGNTRIEYRLWDVFSQRQLNGMAYVANGSNWRRIAHLISDDIYQRMTGENGYFDSRIVYIAETGSMRQKTKRLAIMDLDGANHKYLTSGKELVLTPRFSPNEQMITYLSYKNGKPRVYLYNLQTGRQTILGDFPGMTFAPRFSPDGEKVTMSMAKGGNSDIYELNLKTNRARRITRNSGIDTSPTYSPNGSKIVFESDRGGSQQLYIIETHGDSAKRISFGKGRYANPVWSPRGDLIAFTKMLKGKFYIGVMKPDGSGERLITTAYHVEGPTWAPNGRYLSYFKEVPQGKRRIAKLYAIDLTGYHEWQLKTPHDGSDPAWSPLHGQ